MSSRPRKQDSGAVYTTKSSKTQRRQQATTTANCLLQFYHEIWIHEDKCQIRNILENKQGNSINLDKELCETCIYGKAPTGSRKKAPEPDQLISDNVCGLFDESFHKKRNLVAIE
ncbi:hypothetical protein NPIL_205941 [Nephila pilipes]|uniref:GAG-pre-integrase domain-containing protein n=1 Tax=Nephila pilipes TaxID=299642 RepID=A0A8X6PHI6_NEPPI|nr:hypothetical protein NPIL_205941 [Nephila pilipes]